ncbi:cardiolipin synthase B [Aquincola sp. S2]|uniref:Cardiolipin synthase B n=1 Tax=Pseudaquabacterium terrae TaxID=2732868 RepID=A0ABX2ENP8_9BURK|nr:phospholipase D-like domain-containing protein [Aquabacterium terrae]NRF70198.1 cardiolipin synthase B [Aquabacterium terrae]
MSAGARSRKVGLLLAGALLWLASCGSLPTFVPDLARRAGPPVQLAAAHGPLSASQSKAVLARLGSHGQPTGIFEHHLALEQAIVGSPLTTGNQVLLLQDGPSTYLAMYASIAAARDHIHMETYIFDDDEVGQRFAQVLTDKQRQGVQVRIIRDSVGTIGTPTAFFEQMAAAGIRMLEFNPINPLATDNAWELNQRDHRKLLIVDGHTAFLGGINISSVHSGGSRRPSARTAPDARLAWRDTDLRLRGPVVAELQKLFLATWASQSDAPLTGANHFPPVQSTGTEVVRAIGSSPDDAYSLIYVTLLSAIGSAQTSVHLTNAYFVPDPQLLTALEAAAARGVQVVLILPGQTDSWLVFHAGRGYYARLLRAGVKIHERRGVILHSKTALVDGVWATVGSTNLDWRSFLHNHELDAVVVGTGFGSQLQAMFERDLAASDAVTLAQWERRPLEWRVKELFARLWEHWL